MGSRFEYRRKVFGSVAVLLYIAVVCGSTACVKPRKKPNLPQIFAPARERTGKTPVIVIPGVLGSQLSNPNTGQVVWPSANRYKDDDIDLPITPDLAANRDTLIPTQIVVTTKLSVVLPEVRVYRDLLDTIEKTAGYKPASIDAPPRGGDADTYYIFYYDWRRDNVENARLLSRKIEALKASLGRPDLKFNIVAHSMGSLIARYYAMYGGRDLSEIPETGPDWAGGANISRLVLIGAPNRGAMDALRSLVEGYNYYGGDFKRRDFFNKLDADLIFSLPAIYQLLPFSTAEKYVTAHLEYEKLEIYRVATWRENNWSIFDERHRKKLVDKLGAAGAAERLDQEERFLASALARADAFHDSLERVSTAERPFRLFLFGGDCEPTLRAPFIAMIGGKRKTLFRSQTVRVGRVEVNRKKIKELMFGPGDGRVTRESLLAERTNPETGTLFPSALGIDYAVFACELHGDLPNNGELQNNILSILVTDSTPVPASEDTPASNE